MEQNRPKKIGGKWGYFMCSGAEEQNREKKGLEQDKQEEEAAAGGSHTEEKDALQNQK